MNIKLLKQIMELSSLKNEFWIIFDLLKRELFTFLKESITNINWTKNFLDQLDRIYDDLTRKWMQVEDIIKGSNLSIKRLKGVLYEALFYFSCIYTVSIFKGSWIMQIVNTPNRSSEKPPWFEVIPIYDIQPRLFRAQRNSKWVLKAPQIEADFLICYWDTNTGPLPPAFIDVKSSLSAVKKLSRSQRVWFALGCKLFHNSIFQIAYPKRGISYPKKLEDWHIELVCWKCGALNKNKIYCKECGEKIWLAEDECWRPWPFK